MNARCVLRLLQCSKHGTSWHDSIPSLSPSFHLCLPNPSFTSYFTYFSLDLQSQKRMSCHLHLVHSLQHTICRFLAFFQSHKLRTHFTSRHLFSSLYICYNGLFAHRCITQTNLWSSSKSGSGLKEMNK